MKVATVYNNFSRGKVDHDMNGRFDLPIYQNGADVFQNFISNFKGNAIYRAGFESMLPCDPGDCELIEFKFNNAQSYICVFYAGKIRFLSYDNANNFGWVLNGSSAILEVTSPYTLQQCKELDYSQNADVMILTHADQEPRRLTRTASNAFTLSTYARVNDPFVTLDTTQKTITAVSQANPGVVTANGHGYVTGDKVFIQSVGGMTQVNNLVFTITVLTVNTFSIGVDTTGYTAYTSGGAAQKVTASKNPSCCVFYKGRLFYSLRTTIWGSVVSSYYDHIKTPVTDTAALEFTVADIAEPIKSLFGGDTSLLALSSEGIVSINGGGSKTAITASTIEATLTSADGANEVQPLRKDGLVFYISRTSRNMLYFSYDLLTESFTAADANFISYDITASGLGKIRFKKDRNDLIFALRKDGALLSVNFKKDENINGWHEHVLPTANGSIQNIAVITDNAGEPQLFALTLRNGAWYIERQAAYREFTQRTKFATGDQTADRRAYQRKVAEELKDCVFLDGAQRVTNLKSVSITFNGTTTITAASGVFASGDVGKQIVYRTATGYESGRFEIVAYVSPTVVTVSVLQPPTQNTYASWYLTFSTISGLDQYNGRTVAVFADGGYRSDYLVTGGVIALGAQVTSVVVGYRYTGVIKSFALGFPAGAENTQFTPKNVNGFTIRCVGTAGGKVGPSLYRLQPVQQRKQDDLNYLPPLPIDVESQKIQTSDTAEKDKCFYIVQDEPLPMTVTAVRVAGDYTGDA